MKLEQIEQVVEIARQKSISQAAGNLFISQPSLSLSIQHLEEELGEPLFIRSNKGVRLTPFGKEFVSYAQGILEQTKQLTNLSQNASRRNSAKLSVGSGGYFFVMDACARLYKAHRDSGIEITLGDEVGYNILDKVADGLYEIGVTRVWKFQSSIIRKQMRQKNLQFFPLAQLPLTIMVGRGSPLYYAESDVVRREDLAEFPLVCRSYLLKGPYSGVLREADIPSAKNRIIVNCRAGYYEALDRTPAFYVSASPTPVYGHTREYYPTRVLRLADCDITAEIGWIKNEAYNPTPLANEYLQILTSYFD